MLWQRGEVRAEHGIAAGRDLAARDIVVGIPPSQVAELVRLAVSGRPGDYAELLSLLGAMIPTVSRLHAEALAGFFKTLGEEAVPGERLREKLIGIAEDYQRALAQSAPAPGDKPRTAQLKVEAGEALIRGDLDCADKVLANLHEAQDEAANEQMLEAAATRAQRAAIAPVRLHDREAAALFAEAA